MRAPLVGREAIKTEGSRPRTLAEHRDATMLGLLQPWPRPRNARGPNCKMEHSPLCSHMSEKGGNAGRWLPDSSEPRLNVDVACRA